MVEKQCTIAKIALRGSLCMAKQRLTNEAIAFIIEQRDNPTAVNTWEDIAKMVDKKFGIKLSFQGIAKSYHRNKSNSNIKNIDTGQTQKVAISDDSRKKMQFKPKPVATLSEPLFEKDEETDLKDYF